MPDWRRPKELPDLRRLDRIGLDTETDDKRMRADMGPGWVFRDGHVAGLSIAFRTEGDAQGLYFPIRHPDSDNFTPEQVYQWLRDHIAAGVRFITQNGLYDWGWLRTEAGIKMPEGHQLEEIGALATLIDENRFKYSLDSLCAWRGIPGKDESLLFQGIEALGLHTNKRKKINPQEYIGRLPARFVGPYAERDAVSTLLLFEDLNPIIDQENTRDAYRLEVDILPPVQEMQLRGIRIDSNAAEQALNQILRKRDAALAELSAQLGGQVSMRELNSKKKWMPRPSTALASSIRVHQKAAHHFPKSGWRTIPTGCQAESPLLKSMTTLPARSRAFSITPSTIVSTP